MIAAFLAALGLFPLALPPCATEDSSNCYWNAEARGNGEGRDFAALGPFTFYMEAGQ